MASCLLSRLVPSRFAPPRTFTFFRTRPDASEESLHLNTRRGRVLQHQNTAGQPSSDFVPDGIPSRFLRVGFISTPDSRHSDEDFFNLFQPLQGFEDYRLTTYLHRTNREIVEIAHLQFDTPANATTGAGILHRFGLDSSTIHLTFLPGFAYASWYEDFEAQNADLEIAPRPPSLTVMAEVTINPPARKKPKLSSPVKTTCKICTSEITGPYSKPCLRCKQPWCLDCVKTWFTHATQNSIERMPARCCSVVMHHGVAGGVLSSAELEAYKLKYDERTTANPLYCPIPTCSTFIPPRLIDFSQDTVNCTLCTTRICTKCKQLAATEHACEEEAARAKIKAFNYKTCPRCGTGVMKMHGCPHVRCVCGCHFCYDCMRPINICYRSPCQSAIEDDRDTEEEDGDESDSEDEVGDADTSAEVVHDYQPAQPNSATNPPVERTGTRTTIQAVMNVLRGRRQQRSETEEVRHEETSVTYVHPPEVEPQTESESHTAQTAVIEHHVPSTFVPLPLEVLAAVASMEEPAPVPPIPGSLTQSSTINTQTSTSTVGPAAGESTFAAPVAADVAQSLATELLSAQSSTADLNESDIETSPNPTALPRSDTSATEPATPNLDDPDLLDWEAEDYDFGEEPLDEPFDVWGCACSFTKLKKGDVDEHWMQDLQAHLDCMKCFGEVILQTTPQMYLAASGVQNLKDKLAWHCAKCGVVVCGRCSRAKTKEVKGLIKANGRDVS